MADIMTTDVIAVRPHDSVYNAMDIMVARSVSGLPVTGTSLCRMLLKCRSILVHPPIYVDAALHAKAFRAPAADNAAGVLLMVVALPGDGEKTASDAQHSICCKPSARSIRVVACLSCRS